MSVARILAAGLAASALFGCSSIVEGTTQDIYVSTTPPQADCILERNGIKIGRVDSTPGSVLVSKTKDDIIITCTKEGYQTATYYNDSGWESGSGAAGIALDVVLTAGLSSVIDSATGADNHYEDHVYVTLAPNQPAAEESAAKASAAAETVAKQ